MHLRGDSRAGFDTLLGLLDGSETDEIIEETLRDFGPTAQPWLLETAADARATDHQRLVCFHLAHQGDAASRAALLPLIAEVDLGERFASCIEADWMEDTETMTRALELLRSDSLHPLARARLAALLSPEGLGAAGSDEDWAGATLTQPLAVEALRSASEATTPRIPAIPGSSDPLAGGIPSAGFPAGGAAPPDIGLPDAALPGGSAPRGGGASGGSSAPGAGSPISPAVPPRASSAAPVDVAGKPQLVQVFYGTNRARLDTDHTHHKLAVSVLATAGGSLLAMIMCLVGFLRNGNRAFAAVALLAIGVVAPFGFLAANNYSRASLHAPVAYGVDYQPKVELGICEVSMPPGHRPGMLEGPSIFTLKVTEDVNKHVVLTDVAQLSNDQFYDSLHRTLDKSGKNILVFVHGYNVSFDDAARRTAQMAVDLQFPGAPVFYSWPSQANWYGYATDKENIQRSVAQIKSFLLELAQRSGADTINLVAHSMGNVGLTQALKEIETATPLFNQVVLAAPDIDAEVFKSAIAPSIVTKARHVTLYTSQTDLALIASRYFNHGTRLGDSAGGVVLYPGIDTIDATDVDSSLLGHSYYGSNVTVLSDLGRVLENQPIASRQYLRTVIDASQPYWAFDRLRLSQAVAPAPNH
jgi:esterase/lipase superfamily enzyme